MDLSKIRDKISNTRKLSLTKHSKVIDAAILDILSDLVDILGSQNRSYKNLAEKCDPPYDPTFGDSKDDHKENM